MVNETMEYINEIVFFGMRIKAVLHGFVTGKAEDDQ